VEHSEGREEALDYLLKFGEDGGLFRAPTFVLAKEKHQEEREVEFMEESQKERALYVLHLYCHSSLSTITAKGQLCVMSHCFTPISLSV